jgi:hypothetical protein
MSFTRMMGVGLLSLVTLYCVVGMLYRALHGMFFQLGVGAAVGIGVMALVASMVENPQTQELRARQLIRTGAEVRRARRSCDRRPR